MADAQLDDEDVQAYPTTIPNLHPKNMPVTIMALNYCAASPSVYHHQLSHQPSAARYLISSSWKEDYANAVLRDVLCQGIKKQVNQWTIECLVCYWYKIQRHMPHQIHLMCPRCDSAMSMWTLLDLFPLPVDLSIYSQSLIDILVGQKQYSTERPFI